MYSVVLRMIAFTSLLATFSDPSWAQSIAQFPYEKVCVKSSTGGPDGQTAVVDYEKLQAAAGIDANKFLKGSTFDLQGYQASLAFPLSFFQQQLLLEKGKFFKVYRNGRIVDAIEPQTYIRTPSVYTITCENFGATQSRLAAARKEISQALGSASNKLIVRKDLDNIPKKLASAAPATFAFNSDRLADNHTFQSQFVAASEIPIDIAFEATSIEDGLALTLLPYVRHHGIFNSSNKAKDVDNLAAGLLLNLYPVPVTSWLNATINLSGEYLTDSVNDKEIFASELAIRPYAPADVQWPIELGQRVYFDPLGGGPSIALDLSGRLRYGFVEEAGQVTTLQSESEYLRVGYRAGVDLDFGGSDALSGLTLSAAYIFLHNAIEVGELEHIERFEAGLNYALTPTFGIALGYERGRNEDTLQEVDKVTAGLTIKFGDLARNGTPSF